MNPKRKKLGQPKVQTLRIEFLDEQSQAVCIAGTFNEWRPVVTPRTHLGQGYWVKELKLPPGHHAHRVVVDGQWRCDPTVPEQVPSPHGSHDSVLIVGDMPPQDIASGGTLN